MKVLFVILDGLGDRQYSELKGFTPLEEAITPNLDSLAASGVTGLMYPFRPGIAPSSDLAHFRLFGYSPRQFPGRGYLEALGEGVPVEDDDVVFRTSFIKVEEGKAGFTVAAREIENEEEAAKDAVGKIENMTFNDVNCRFVYTGSRQGLLIMSGGVSPEVTDSDPLAIGLPIGRVEPIDEAKEMAGATAAADAANAFMLRSAEALRGLPLNFLALKWAGRHKDNKTFTEKTSLKGAIVAEGALYKGMAEALGMEFVPGSSEGSRAALKSGLKQAADLFSNGVDFVHVHSKAPDKAGHKKNPIDKSSVIEKLDAALSGIEGTKDTLVVVTGDHATPSGGPQIHSGEAVPIVMAGGKSGRDDVTKFGETACLRGSLGVIQGRDVMPMILNFTDRANYLGLRPYSYKTNARPDSARANPLKPA